MSIKAASKEYKVPPAPPATRSASSCNLQAFIEQLSSQLSSDVARLIKELKTQADEAIREAEKFDKIRSDFSGTIQKIEVKPALASLLRCLCRRVFCRVVTQSRRLQLRKLKVKRTPWPRTSM